MDFEPSTEARGELTGRAVPRRTATVVIVAGIALLALVAVLVQPSRTVLLETGGSRVPTAVAYAIDWADSQAKAGDFRGALRTDLDALSLEPESGSLNFHIATLYVALDQERSALPFAAAADRVDPGVASHVALHGTLLVAAGDGAAADRCAERLAGVEPANAADAAWMSDFYRARGELGEALRVTAAGLAEEPHRPDLLARRFFAFVELGRMDDADALLAAEPDSVTGTRSLELAMLFHRLHTDPDAGLDQLVEGWMSRGLAPRGRRLLLAKAEEWGVLDAARQRLAEYLLAPETPQEAWVSAQPWFELEAWKALLDRLLAERLETIPAVLRLRLYSPWTEADRIRRLAGSLRLRDDPAVQFVDGAYFGAGVPGRSMAELESVLARHLEQTPDHPYCSLWHLDLVVRLDPDRAADLLTALRHRADDPAQLAMLTLEDAKIRLRRGEPRQALALLDGFDPYSAIPYTSATEVDLVAATAAFAAGDAESLRQRMGWLQHDRLDSWQPLEGPPATALLVRWSDQLVHGEPVTYRSDVADWLANRGEEALLVRQAEAQALLAAEGRVSEEERRAVLPVEVGDAFDLVALFKRAGKDGEMDWEGLRRVADSPYRYQFEPFLARTILRRRGGAAALTPPCPAAARGSAG